MTKEIDLSDDLTPNAIVFCESAMEDGSPGYMVQYIRSDMPKPLDFARFKTFEEAARFYKGSLS